MGHVRRSLIRMPLSLLAAALLWAAASGLNSPGATMAQGAGRIQENVGESTEKYDQVYAASDYFCARISANTTPLSPLAKQLRCWGSPGSDRFPRTRPDNISDPAVDLVGEPSHYKYVVAALGDNGGCGIIDDSGTPPDDKRIHCWGLSVQGSGVPPGASSYGMLSLPDTQAWADISAYGNTFCARKGSEIARARPGYRDKLQSEVVCWGDNSSGQAMMPGATELGEPGALFFNQISVGPHVTCGDQWDQLGTLDRRVICWGNPEFGHTRPIGAKERYNWATNNYDNATSDFGIGKELPRKISDTAPSTRMGWTNWLAVGGQSACAQYGSYEIIHRTDASKDGTNVMCWGTSEMVVNYEGDDIVYLDAGHTFVCGIQRAAFAPNVKCFPRNNPLFNFDEHLYAVLAVGSTYIAAIRGKPRQLALGDQTGTDDGILDVIGYPSDEMRLTLNVDASSMRGREVPPTAVPKGVTSWGSQSFPQVDDQGAGFWGSIDNVPGGRRGMQLVMMLGMGLWLQLLMLKSPYRYQVSFIGAGGLGVALWSVGIGHWNTVVLLTLVALLVTFAVKARR